MSIYFVKNIKKLHSQKVTKKELVQDFYKTSIRCCIRKVSLDDRFYESKQLDI